MRNTIRRFDDRNLSRKMQLSKGGEAEKKFELFCRRKKWEFYKFNDIILDKKRFIRVLSKLGENKKRVIEASWIAYGIIGYEIKGYEGVSDKSTSSPGTTPYECQFRESPYFSYPTPEGPLYKTKITPIFHLTKSERSRLCDSVRLLKEYPPHSGYRNQIKKFLKDNPDTRVELFANVKGMPDYLVFDASKSFLVEVKANDAPLSSFQKRLIKVLLDYFDVHLFRYYDHMPKPRNFYFGVLKKEDLETTDGVLARYKELRRNEEMNIWKRYFPKRYYRIFEEYRNDRQKLEFLSKKCNVKPKKLEGICDKMERQLVDLDEEIMQKVAKEFGKPEKEVMKCRREEDDETSIVDELAKTS